MGKELARTEAAQRIILHIFGLGAPTDILTASILRINALLTVFRKEVSSHT